MPATRVLTRIPSMIQPQHTRPPPQTTAQLIWPDERENLPQGRSRSSRESKTSGPSGRRTGLSVSPRDSLVYGVLIHLLSSLPLDLPFHSRGDTRGLPGYGHSTLPDLVGALGHPHRQLRGMPLRPLGRSARWGERPRRQHNVRRLGCCIAALNEQVGYIATCR